MVIMIILLILCLPLILMLSLYTTTNVVSVVADVPVTGIVLNMDKTDIPVLNLDKEDKFVVDYTVMPQGATNKAVSYTFVNAETGERVDAFDVEGNILTPKINGKFEVWVSTDGGPYKDKFLIYVNTNRVTAIDSSLKSESIFVGETTEIETVFTPKDASNQSLNYTVKEGADIVKIVNGKIKGIGIGTAVIEVSSGDKPEVKDEVTLTVGSSGVFDYVDVDEFATILETNGFVNLVVNPELESYVWNIALTDTQGLVDPYSVIDVVFNGEEGKLEYEFKDTSFIGKIEIALTITPDGEDPVTKICSVSRLTDVSISWEEESSYRSYPVYCGDKIVLEIDVQPKVADVTYLITAQFTSGTALQGTVQSGVQITLEEGVRYTCDGGYISFMLSENTITIYGDKTVEDVSKISDTLTTLRIIAIDNAGGKTVDLKTKKITVIPISNG